MRLYAGVGVDGDTHRELGRTRGLTGPMGYLRPEISALPTVPASGSEPERQHLLDRDYLAEAHALEGALVSPVRIELDHLFALMSENQRLTRELAELRESYHALRVCVSDVTTEAWVE